MTTSRHPNSKRHRDGRVGASARLIGTFVDRINAGNADRESAQARHVLAWMHSVRGMGQLHDDVECLACAKPVKFYKQFKKGRHRNVEFHYAPCGLICVGRRRWLSPEVYHQDKGRVHRLDDCPTCGPITTGLLRAFRQYWKRKAAVEGIHDPETGDLPEP